MRAGRLPWCACWLALLAAWPALAGKPVEIDTAQSRIGFTLKTRWGQSLDGRFPQWRGEIVPAGKAYFYIGNVTELRRASEKEGFPGGES